MKNILALTIFCLTMAGLVTNGSSSAFAISEMDRIRCQVDIGVDALGNPLNQVQIQVKIDGSENLNVWVVNPRTSLASPTHLNLPSIGGTVAADWDSSPDLDPTTGEIPPGVLLIDPNFVADGDSIIAHAGYIGGGEIPTMEASCDIKVSAQFRQQTKPPAGADIVFTSSKGKLVKGNLEVELRWDGGFTSTVDIRRDLLYVATGTLNTGRYSDIIENFSNGPLVYSVCEDGPDGNYCVSTSVEIKQ